MNKIFISTDSTADVTDELGRELSLSFIRFSVGTRAFCLPDRIYSPDDALDCFLKTENVKSPVVVPKTADYEELFDDLAEAGGSVVHISQGAFWSKAYKNACAAAKNTMVKYKKSLVLVLDSRSTAAGQALVLDYALAEKSKNARAEEIFALSDELSQRVERYFILPDVSRFNKLFPSAVGNLAQSAQTVAMVSVDESGGILSVKRCSSFVAACKLVSDAYVAADCKYPCYAYGSACVEPLLKAVSVFRKRSIRDIRMSSMGAANCCTFGKDAVSVAFIGNPKKAEEKKKFTPGKPSDFFNPEEN